MKGGWRWFCLIKERGRYSEETVLIKSVLEGDEAKLGLASETAGRSEAEMREMFIKCLAFALHNYQFCAIWHCLDNFSTPASAVGLPGDGTASSFPPVEPRSLTPGNKNVAARPAAFMLLIHSANQQQVR